MAEILKKEIFSLQYNYMLTRDRNIGYWHMNLSDIIHYHHGGCTLTYLLLDPSKGKIEKKRLGQNIASGDVLQLVVPGGTWKATVLMSEDEGSEHDSCDWGLLGEAVAPGFDICDMKFGTKENMAEFTEIWEDVAPYIKNR